MIKVTRINKTEQFYVNENMIEFMEQTPDTVIALETGKRIVVDETPEKIIDLIIEQKKRLLDYQNPQFNYSVIDKV
jgi:flagellar protein FlbD